MDGQLPSNQKAGAFDPKRITRPAPALLKYYLLSSLAAGPGFPFVFLPLFFKYRTLEYRFGQSGVSMSWGILLRREIHLTYRRIQDIHLTRNIIQRWMGLSTINIQTASGGSGPEMSIEGILSAEQLRDYLSARMRGVKDQVSLQGPGQPDPVDGEPMPGKGDEALVLLREIRDALRQWSLGAGRRP